MMWIMSIDDEDEDEVGNRPVGIGHESERKNEHRMGGNVYEHDNKR